MEDCWLYAGVKTSTGYGRISVYDGRSHSISAHRAVYKALVGPIPEGLELDHLCKIRCCINPEHLEPVTHYENCLRSKYPNMTHCKNGHEFTPENTKLRFDKKRSRGYWRLCLTCHREQSKRNMRAMRQRVKASS